MPGWSMWSGSYRTPPATDNINLFQASQTFENGVAWVPISATITPNSALAPDGTLTAETITEGTANSAHRIAQTVTIVAGIDYTLSLHVKSGSANRKFNIGWSPDGAFASFFDPDTGTFVGNGAGFGSGTFINNQIEALPNGWYRVSLAGRAGGLTSVSFNLNLALSAGTNVYVGDGASNVLIWGAQLELGNKAGIYRVTS